VVNNPLEFGQARLIGPPLLLQTSRIIVYQADESMNESAFMKSRYALALVPFVLTAPPAQATTYLSVAQAQAALFPGETLQPSFHSLSDAQVDAIRNASGQSPSARQVRAWRASGGGWLIVDRVIGKHDFITFAVALSAEGAVRTVEIMDYREAYGSEVRDKRWRAQFAGKRAGDVLQLGREVRNISGATLSSRHVTEGVRRVLATYALILAHS
jgi:FMN-binding domain